VDPGTLNGDDLGDHTATQDLDLGAFTLVGNGGTQGIDISSGGTVEMTQAPRVTRLSGSQAGAGVYLNTSSATGSGMKMAFQSGATVTMAEIGHRVGASTAEGNLVFATRGTNVINERMRLTNTGRLGIGMTDPDATLDVAGSIEISGAGRSVISNPTAVGRQIMQLRGEQDIANGAGINLYGDSDSTTPGETKFYNGGATRMTITPTGGVGIGTTNIATDTALNIVGPTVGRHYVYIGNQTDGMFVGVNDSEHAVIRAERSNSVVRMEVGSALIATFRDTGRMGIGTFDPDVELDVDTGSINAAEICDENNANCIDLSAGLVASSVRRLATAPSSGLVSGQTYYNTTDNTTYVFDGSQWRPFASSGDSDSVLQDTDPATNLVGASEGDIAYDTSDNELQVFDGSSWVSVADNAGDDLGDHTATTNIQLGSNYLSGDGGNEGILINSDGIVRIENNSTGTSAALQVTKERNGNIYYPTINVNRLHTGSTIPQADFATGIRLQLEHSSSLNGTPSEKMRITSDGDVGIGIEDPSVGLHLGQGTGGIIAEAFTGGNATLLSLRNMHAGASANMGTGMSFIASANQLSGAIKSAWDAASSANAHMKFELRAGGVNSVEKMRLDSVGMLVTGDLSITGNADKPGGGSWDVSSDIRLKDQSSFEDYTYGLDDLMQLKPIYYNYAEGNARGHDSSKTHVGFVAQHVQDVIPDAVSEDSKGFLQINNDPIIWTILNAVKELAVQVKGLVVQVADAFLKIADNSRQIAEMKESYESRLSKLEKENEELKAQNESSRKDIAEIKTLLKGMQSGSRMPASVEED